MAGYCELLKLQKFEDELAQEMCEIAKRAFPTKMLSFFEIQLPETPHPLSIYDIYSLSSQRDTLVGDARASLTSQIHTLLSAFNTDESSLH